MKLKLVFNTRPQPHQSVRFTRKGIGYKPKKIVDYQKYIQRLAEEQLAEDFVTIEAGIPIYIKQLTYQYAFPKSWSKRKKSEGGYKTTKPDLQDNLNKAFLDALEGIVYEQDQNIVSIEKLEKVWGETDKITLILEY